MDEDSRSPENRRARWSRQSALDPAPSTAALPVPTSAYFSDFLAGLSCSFLPAGKATQLDLAAAFFVEVRALERHQQESHGPRVRPAPESWSTLGARFLAEESSLEGSLSGGVIEILPAPTLRV